MKPFIDSFGEAGVLTATHQAQITSLLSAGTFFGALGQAFTADSIGRKGSIIVSRGAARCSAQSLTLFLSQLWSVIFTIGVVIQTASDTSRPQLLAGRLIAGLGIGALRFVQLAPSLPRFLFHPTDVCSVLPSSCLVPLMNGESAPRHLRGPALVLYQTMIIAGLFSSYLIDWGTHHFLNSASWRVSRLTEIGV